MYVCIWAGALCDKHRLRPQLHTESSRKYPLSIQFAAGVWEFWLLRISSGGILCTYECKSDYIPSRKKCFQLFFVFPFQTDHIYAFPMFFLPCIILYLITTNFIWHFMTYHSFFLIFPLTELDRIYPIGYI